MAPQRVNAFSTWFQNGALIIIMGLAGAIFRLVSAHSDAQDAAIRENTISITNNTAQISANQIEIKNIIGQVNDLNEVVFIAKK